MYGIEFALRVAIRCEFARDEFLGLGQGVE
jgi:hypothetical protein